jgi:hypothetical protein
VIHDPLTPWSGPFPYEALAAAGVTPATTQDQMREVPFELMAARMMTPDAQRACKELSVLRTRLLADLLLYDVDLPKAVAEARAEVEEALRDPGEPPEVARWLAPGWPPADRLVEELDGVALPPQPEPPEWPEQGGPPEALPGFGAALVAQLLKESVSFDT